MGNGLLHYSNTSGRIGAVLARSEDSHGCGEKVDVGANTVTGGCPKSSSDLLYLEIRRGTQVAQGRGLQNLHSWVRIPPAPPSPFMRLSVNLSSCFCGKGRGLGDLSSLSNWPFWPDFQALEGSANNLLTGLWTRAGNCSWSRFLWHWPRFRRG